MKLATPIQGLRAQITQRVTVFGNPLLLKLQQGSRIIRRPFIGQGDGAVAMVLTAAGTKQGRELRPLTISGTNRTNVAVRAGIQAGGEITGTLPLASNADATKGITTECVSGRLEEFETAEEALDREAEEEAAVTGGFTFIVGPPTFPDARWSIEAHFHGIKVRPGLDPETLHPEGDESGGEFGQHADLTNLQGLLELQRTGRMPFDHNLLTLLRLRAALGTKASSFNWDGTAKLPRAVTHPGEFSALPNEVFLSEELSRHVLTGTEGRELNVVTHRTLVKDPAGTATELPFPTMISYPTGEIDSVSFLITFTEDGRRYVIVPEPSLQPIYYARQLERARLSNFNRAIFATGIEAPVPVSVAYAQNKITASSTSPHVLETTMRHSILQQLLGPIAAVKAKISEAHGMGFPTHGVLAKAVHPRVVTIDNPTEISLAAGYQVLELEAAFEMIGRGDIIDRTLETMMLHLAFQEGREVPRYFDFDTSSFLAALN